MVTGPLLRAEGLGSREEGLAQLLLLLSHEESELCLLPQEQSLWQEQCPWQFDPGPANEAVMKLRSSHAFGQGVLVFQTSAVLGVVTGVSHSLCALWEWVGLVYPRQFRVWLQCEGLGAFCCPGLSQQCHLVLPSPGWRFSAVLGPALLGNVLNSPCVVHEAFWT